MKVQTLDESAIADIGHAFGYYDYGAEQGLASAFPSREATAAFIRGYVRMALQSGMMHTTSELAGMRRFGEHGVLYDLSRYPAAMPRK